MKISGQIQSRSFQSKLPGHYCGSEATASIDKKTFSLSRTRAAMWTFGKTGGKKWPKQAKSNESQWCASVPLTEPQGRLKENIQWMKKKNKRQQSVKISASRIVWCFIKIDQPTETAAEPSKKRVTFCVFSLHLTLTRFSSVLFQERKIWRNKTKEAPIVSHHVF